MESVRMGVLGCADIARRRMLPAFAACPATEVAAVASRNAECARRVAAEYGARAVHGYEELLADPGVEAVYVPVPAALHAEWVEKALLSGKHVLAEKPLTTNAGTTAALFRLAESRGLALMENVMFVHHSQHARVVALIAEGAIGDLRSFQAAFTVPRRPVDDIRYRPDLGGGALLDTGVYPVRAAATFLGPELKVVGAGLASGAGFRVDTAGAVLLQSPDGISAQLTFGLDHAYRNSYELQGSTGRITLDRVFTPPADHVPVAVVEGPSGSRRIPLLPDDQVANTVAVFAEAVRAGSAPYEEVLRQARLLDDVQRLAAQN
ncbi:Gfo/Idh/MocA family protein [Streptomyces sp. NPDC015346]|uniref:Gfo/Idh/MocA family protein n=1 Tax=Streptomyces sp. NPDC015346 TaxID=3364954 RepID=UPI0036FFF4C8